MRGRGIHIEQRFYSQDPEIVLDKKELRKKLDADYRVFIASGRAVIEVQQNVRGIKQEEFWFTCSSCGIRYSRTKDIEFSKGAKYKCEKCRSKK